MYTDWVSIYKSVTACCKCILVAHYRDGYFPFILTCPLSQSGISVLSVNRAASDSSHYWWTGYLQTLNELDNDRWAKLICGYDQRFLMLSAIIRFISVVRILVLIAQLNKVSSLIKKYIVLWVVWTGKLHFCFVDGF